MSKRFLDKKEIRAFYDRFGSRQGSFALDLLQRHLPFNASYIGADISSTMARLARQRLTPFGDRVRILHTDGSLCFGFPDGSFDRFVSMYVLDLFSPEEIVQVVDEAYRLLRNDGLICLVSLTHGQTVISKTVTWIWKSVHNLNPVLVGGCRPLKLVEFLDERCWNMSYHNAVNMLGIASEIVVAVKTTGKYSQHEYL